jgi:hypothetical protein
MDRDFIEDVVRSLAASPTRPAVFGLTVGGLLGVIHFDAAGAKRGKGKKKGKTGCGADQPVCPARISVNVTHPTVRVVSEKVQASGNPLSCLSRAWRRPPRR